MNTCSSELAKYIVHIWKTRNYSMKGLVDFLKESAAIGDKVKFKELEDFITNAWNTVSKKDFAHLEEEYVHFVAQRLGKCGVVIPIQFFMRPGSLTRMDAFETAMRIKAPGDGIDAPNSKRSRSD